MLTEVHTDRKHFQMIDKPLGSIHLINVWMLTLLDAILLKLYKDSFIQHAYQMLSLSRCWQLAWSSSNLRSRWGGSVDGRILEQGKFLEKVVSEAEDASQCRGKPSRQRDRWNKGMKPGQLALGKEQWRVCMEHSLTDHLTIKDGNTLRGAHIYKKSLTDRLSKTLCECRGRKCGQVAAIVWLSWDLCLPAYVLRSLPSWKLFLLCHLLLFAFFVTPVCTEHWVSTVGALCPILCCFISQGPKVAWLQLAFF